MNKWQFDWSLGRSMKISNWVADARIQSLNIESNIAIEG